MPTFVGSEVYRYDVQVKNVVFEALPYDIKIYGKVSLTYMYDTKILGNYDAYRYDTRTKTGVPYLFLYDTEVDINKDIHRYDTRIRVGIQRTFYGDVRFRSLGLQSRLSDVQVRGFTPKTYRYDTDLRFSERSVAAFDTKIRTLATFTRRFDTLILTHRQTYLEIIPTDINVDAQMLGTPELPIGESSTVDVRLSLRENMLAPWNVNLTSGYYFMGQHQFYSSGFLFSEDLDVQPDKSVQLVSFPMVGTPVMVQTGGGRWLTPVFFVDSSGEESLEAEFVLSAQKDCVDLGHTNIDPATLQITRMDTEQVLPFRKIKHSTVQLWEPISPHISLHVRFYVQDSYIVKRREPKEPARIYFHDVEEGELVHVYYHPIETDMTVESCIDVNPMRSLQTGELYMDPVSEQRPASSISMMNTIQAPADGAGRHAITVFVQDAHGNPVHGAFVELTTEPYLFRPFSGAYTGQDGYVVLDVIAPSQAGLYTVTARTRGLSAQATCLFYSSVRQNTVRPINQLVGGGGD